MSAVMLAGQKLGLMGGQPPELITAAALDSSGVHDRDEETQDALSTAAHFAFGMAAGSVFVLLHRRLRLPIPPVLQGIIYGSLVWAAAYKGVIPAIGIMPEPERDRPGRPVVMLAAHWVYGAALGATVHNLEHGSIFAR
jgi:hypothetical protein